MNITIRNNRIYVEHAELGTRFPDLISDLVIDPKGRVKVQISVPFYTDLNCLHPSILFDIAKKLDAEQDNRTLMKLKKKIDRIAHAKLVNGIIK